MWVDSALGADAKLNQQSLLPSSSCPGWSQGSDNDQSRKLPMVMRTQNRNSAKRWRTAVGGTTALHVGLPDAVMSEMSREK